MAISEHATGSQTATISTEHSLGTDPDTTDGAFALALDVANMVRGDRLEIRVYEKARSTDTARQIHVWTLNDEQDDDLFISPTLTFLHGWHFSIKQTTGTGRAFPWSVRKIA